MAEWPKATVESCLEHLSLRRVPKLQTRDYKLSGNYPIIDQGRTRIAGWTDDDSGLISTNLPVVVFGDHTRTLKYVDFPFVRGADGTQILKPKDGIEPLFFYYACKAIKLPNRGYNRHFKILKEHEIPIPPLNDQHSISRILCLIDDSLYLQDKQLQMAINAKRAAMQELFTRGLRGEAQKETEIGPMPENWSVGYLGSLCVPTHQLRPSMDPHRQIRYVDVSSVSRITCKVESTTIHKFHDAPSRARKEIISGDVIFATVRPTLLRAARIGKNLDGEVCSTAFCVLRDKNSSLNGRFIFQLVRRVEFVTRLERIEAGASYPAVNDRKIKNQLVPIPPDDEQHEITAILEAIDRKIDLHQRKGTVLDEIFKALVNKLMTGEVRVDDLDLLQLNQGNS